MKKLNKKKLETTPTRKNRKFQKNLKSSKQIKAIQKVTYQKRLKPIQTKNPQKLLGNNNYVPKIQTIF